MVCSLCGAIGHNATTCALAVRAQRLIRLRDQRAPRPRHSARLAEPGSSTENAVDVEQESSKLCTSTSTAKRQRKETGVSNDSLAHDDPTAGLQKCPICFEDPMPVPIMQACSSDNTHVMCGVCWKKRRPTDRCPLCRADAPVQDMRNGIACLRDSPPPIPHVACSLCPPRCAPTL